MWVVDCGSVSGGSGSAVSLLLRFRPTVEQTGIKGWSRSDTSSNDDGVARFAAPVLLDSSASNNNADGLFQ